MKKTKLSLCLASSFVAAISLAACGNGVTSSDNAIITIKDSNGLTRNILTDSVYASYKKETTGVSQFYNAILESLIRYEYENPNQSIREWTKSIKRKATIEEEAKSNVKNDKNTADENAKSNGTSYEEEWKKILDSHNCEDEAELLQYYVYQIEKEDITDKFFLNQNDTTLTTEWIGINEDGEKASEEVKGVFPYHIRHVLISISGGSTNFYDGTITQDEANNIGNVMNALLDVNYSFSDVAQKFSGDSGSAAKGGDVGIMSTTTSFVNEFKLGIYAYDAIYNHNTAETKNDVIKEGLGLDEAYTFALKNKDGSAVTETSAANAFAYLINDGKLQTVPYEAFLKIKSFAETTTNAKGKQVNNNNTHYYPRNVLYNYYLNFHNPFVITNEKLDAKSGLVDPTAKLENDHFNADGILTDGNGNVIIGVRSEHGIHLMIMEKSIYDFDAAEVDPNEASLEEYYTSHVPSDDEFPRTQAGALKETYVNFITTTDASTYTARANEVKNAVKSFDSTYDYRLFEYILNIEANNISIKDAELRTNIAEYISRTRTNNKQAAYDTLNSAWRTYTELVALQYDNRTVWTDVQTTTKDFKMIHPRCAIGFKDHTGDENAWKEGGVCYYEE